MKTTETPVKVYPDKDGFYSIKDKKPTAYDLCILVGSNGKTVMGWRTNGNQFDGNRIHLIDEVIAWKKTKEM